jgi:hypothetical protein
MINCFNVNLHINPLKEGIDINSYNTIRRIKIPPADIINNDLFILMNRLDLEITDAEVFYVKPNITNTIHTDHHGGDYVKLNYIYGGKDSYMAWYRQKPEIIKNVDKTLDYVAFSLHEVELIEKQSILNLNSSIVQVGIPHNIINFEEPRYCFSISLCHKGGWLAGRLKMDEAIKIFKPYHV